MAAVGRPSRPKRTSGRAGVAAGWRRRPPT